MDTMRPLTEMATKRESAPRLPAVPKPTLPIATAYKVFYCSCALLRPLSRLPLDSHLHSPTPAADFPGPLTREAFSSAPSHGPPIHSPSTLHSTCAARPNKAACLKWVQKTLRGVARGCDGGPHLAARASSFTCDSVIPFPQATGRLEAGRSVPSKGEPKSAPSCMTRVGERWG
ncbi:hypothetical protein EJ04DRAFT_1129 [Polyplosphaeria fusca]|uniref:Uncharacterized protein n=1 Tax=Polyplosphaeria fusca TaxID=682080 RepID=A0A9P4R928_9PLEO|nr:hypothetical protein EJ04DRAFT_1129 [Polyplosphaeria fusca]